MAIIACASVSRPPERNSLIFLKWQSRNPGLTGFRLLPLSLNSQCKLVNFSFASVFSSVRREKRRGGKIPFSYKIIICGPETAKLLGALASRALYPPTPLAVQALGGRQAACPRLLPLLIEIWLHLWHYFRLSGGASVMKSQGSGLELSTGPLGWASVAGLQGPHGTAGERRGTAGSGRIAGLEGSAGSLGC